ncbi:MAG: hypothetical protein PHT52_02115 [Eubacteriales bacterium]|nr:hypothetical protein [Eubacteriales bacterium]MDD4078169.1 hypothetical protein [Eubacteriales bacterium]MDD4768556.1 hypothetical protein [Eubacteriales bacterium]
MQLKKRLVIALCILTTLSLFLSACGGSPVQEIPEPDEGSNNKTDTPPQVKGLQDLDPLPYSILYIDNSQNLVQLNLSDKTPITLAERVSCYAPDWSRQRIALAIKDPNEEFAEQGAVEIEFYSYVDGKTERLDSSYLFGGLRFSPTYRFLICQSALGCTDIYDLETGKHYDAGDNTCSLFIFDEWPLWSPDGMRYAMHRLLPGENDEPLGVYVVDPLTEKETLVLRAFPEKKIRTNSWLDEDNLLIEFEPEPYTWLDPEENEKDINTAGNFMILDLQTKARTDTSSPEPAPWPPQHESPDGVWVLYEEYDDRRPQGKIWLKNKDTNITYLLGEGNCPLWVEDN